MERTATCAIDIDLMWPDCAAGRLSTLILSVTALLSAGSWLKGATRASQTHHCPWRGRDSDFGLSLWHTCLNRCCARKKKRNAEWVQVGTSLKHLVFHPVGRGCDKCSSAYSSELWATSASSSHLGDKWSCTFVELENVQWEIICVVLQVGVSWTAAPERGGNRKGGCGCSYEVWKNFAK